MIQREDFWRILSETVKEYYQKVHHKSILFEYEKKPGLETVIVNDKLSFVCRPQAPSGLRRFLLAEYNVRGSKIKYVLGKVIVHIICKFPSIGKRRTAFITQGVLGKDVFISPQNRSIRFFDYGSMTVDCIVKKEFSSYYFQNQLQFRKNNHYSFMVPLIESGDNWFREPILSGNALARTTNQTMYEKGFTDVLNAIRQLANDTCQKINSIDYMRLVQGKLEMLILEAENKKGVANLENIREIIKNACDAILEYPISMFTVMSHGDLQGGNVWINEQGKTLIYDWETVDRRSIWYDVAVFCYSLRRVYGWKTLINDSTAKCLFYCDTAEKHDEKELYVIKNILLLEEFTFYLEDMIELPNRWGREIFNGFTERMIEVLKDGNRIPGIDVREGKD